MYQNVFSEDEAFGAVLAKKGFALQIFENCHRLVKNFGRKPSSRKRILFLGQAAGDTRQFFRKTARKTVDADSENQTVDFAVFEVGLRFCKDAADFFIVVKKVVDPFNFCLHASNGLDGTADGNGSGHGDVKCFVQIKLRLQSNGEIETSTGWRGEGSAKASSSASLLVGNDHHRLVFERKFLCYIVSRIYGVKDLQVAGKSQIASNGVDGQHIGL